MRFTTLATTLAATASIGAYAQSLNATYITAVIEALK